MGKVKLYPKSRVMATSDVGNELSEMDSVAHGKMYASRRSFEILMLAYTYWGNMSQFRKDRERAKNFTYGKQWEDLITVDGKTMTEEQYIRSQGNTPLKNNLVRRLVKNVLGVYRNQGKEPTCTAVDRDEQQYSETMSTILQCNWRANKMKELNARSMEEFLISGLIVHKKIFGWNDERYDCWTKMVNDNRLIVDSNMRDFSGRDVSMIGEIHDVSFLDICREFATSPEEYQRLSDIYRYAKDKSRYDALCDQFGYSHLRDLDFFAPPLPGVCRVIEIWNKESKPRYRCHDPNTGDYFKIEIEDYESEVVAVNNERIRLGLQSNMKINDIPLIEAEWFIDSYWYYRYLTPTGEVLREGETPYAHKSHPYVLKAYPFIDGEIHSFVSDFIDQQIYVNRLVTMHDWIMRSSAKGLLMFPEECLPDSMSIEDIADEWSRFNGMILYKAKPGVEAPKQVSNNSTNIGIAELLNIQLQFFEDISGVNGALQGKPGYSSTSGALYAQQTQNATTSLIDMLDTFSDFVVDGAYKDVKNMQQCYTSKRIFSIVGKSGAKVVYDPAKMSDIEFEHSIVEGKSTAAYRQLANEFLMQIWSSGQISLELLLEHGDFPFADQLLQSIKSQKEQLANGEVPDGISPQLMEQVRQGANQQAVNAMRYGGRAA